MDHLHLDLESVELEIFAARTMLSELDDVGYELSDDDFALSMSARLLPEKVLSAAEAREVDLAKLAKVYAMELSQEQQSFVGRMAQLARDAEGFRELVDLDKADENHKRATELQAALALAHTRRSRRFVPLARACARARASASYMAGTRRSQGTSLIV